jgi:hypothetical protein
VELKSVKPEVETGIALNNLLMSFYTPSFWNICLINCVGVEVEKTGEILLVEKVL